MKPIYEIWDYETSNLLDAYATEQAALDDVLDTIRTEGLDAVATWALLRDDQKAPSKIASSCVSPNVDRPLRSGTCVTQTCSSGSQII